MTLSPTSSRGSGTATVATPGIVGYPFAQQFGALGSTNIFFMRVWVPVAYTATSYSFTIGTASGNMLLGIYTVAGALVTRESSFAVPAAGGRTRTITGGPTALAAGDYWVGLQFDGATATVGIFGNNIAQAGLTFIAANTFASGMPGSVTPVVTLNGTFIALSLI